MKFSQIPYKRPPFEEANAKLEDLLKRFKEAKTLEAVRDTYKEYDNYMSHISTMFNLASIRNTINTKDEFYLAEKEYSDEVVPKLQPVMKEFSTALLESPFRKELEAEWGKLMFLNTEIELKTFKPEIVADLQEENRLSTEYDNLIASAEIDFDGQKLNLSQIRPYFESADRAVRKASTEAMSKWFIANSDGLDKIFDQLVIVRTRIAKTLGYDSFTELGYYRMQRNCYDADMVAKFRNGVAEYIVPIANQLKAAQAKRIGVDALKIYDDAFEYPDGNANPQGSPDDIFAHGKKMYHELSKETAEFIDFMLENELFDVLSKPGKAMGGYCTTLPDYKAPFIFANFNGTSADIDVLTHEAGHAYAAYVARDIYPSALQSYSYETAEIHSMAMEFFTWPWMEGFFGKQAQKYRHSHLSRALSFLPYGVMVDEFQHHLYAKPEMSAAERNACWLKLEAKYRPWLKFEDIPFYETGRHWQMQLHIYVVPFYYIDYCLAQIIALCFWAENQKDPKVAWDKYRRLVGFAGTKTFVELITDADLPTPFESANLKIVSDAATEWLKSQN